MARVLYGISGEGSGHSSRAREMMRHLLAQGHEVRAVSYDQGYRNLKDDFDVFETEGLSIATEENRVSVVQTFVDNLKRLPSGARHLAELRRVCFDSFQPDCVLTDFEPMTAYVAHHEGLPLVTLDNQHRMRYMRYPRPQGLGRSARITETVIRMMVPRPDLSLVTTFYFGEVSNQRTRLFPPILRREIHAAHPTREDFVLVYFTQGFDEYLEHLRACPREQFRVYGSGKRGRDGNLDFQPRSRDGFLADLTRCKAVISTAGFTLMTESLHLAKPFLALPMEGQFEQELNAHLLDDLGCGKNGRERSAASVGDFLYRLPEYEAALERYPRSDNRAITSMLDELLADDAQMARDLHVARNS